MNLVLLPGLMCDSAVWAPVLPWLGRTVRCRIPDYGSANSLAAMAERVLADAPPTFALAGHSMGGRVALEIARRAADRVSRLALLDTGYKPRPAGLAGDDEKARRFELLALAHSQGMRAMAAEWTPPMVHPERRGDAALVGAILDMFERRTPAEFEAQIQALLARPDATPVLHALTCPTLVLCGRDDGWSPPAQHEAMARLVESARLVVIDRCGHMAPMERPREVGKALRDWLALPVLVGALPS